MFMFSALIVAWILQYTQTTRMDTLLQWTHDYNANLAVVSR